MFSTQELATAWADLRREDRERAQVPHPWNYSGPHEDFLSGRPGLPGPGCSAAARVARFPVPQGARIRWLSMLEPSDHVEYRAAVSRVADRIEAALGPGVVANRVCRPDRRDPCSWRLESWRPARRRFRRSIANVVGSGPAAVVVADVEDFYGRIRPETVERALRETGCAPTEIEPLTELLERLAQAGLAGLPVGPEPSAVLANAVLAAADRAATMDGSKMVRWVDDFVIACSSRQAAEGALGDLESALERLGLGVARHKTRILEGGRAREARLGLKASGPEDLAVSRRADGTPDESAFESLEAAPRPDSALANLKVLRRMCGRPLGTAERALLATVARDARRPAPVRAWARRVAADAGASRGARHLPTEVPPPGGRTSPRGLLLPARRAG